MSLRQNGPVYHDASSCESLHPHCTCAAVPTWDRDKDGNYKLDYPGYDPDYYYDRYKNPEKYKDETLMFRSLADPALDFFGPAEVSHPNELSRIKDDLAASGVTVVTRAGGKNAMGYGPSGTPGYPGSMAVTEGMSYSAWLHEYEHFSIDRDLGYPGHMYYLSDLGQYANHERLAYGKEIDLARENGYNELADKIEEIRDKAISDILEGNIWS